MQSIWLQNGGSVMYRNLIILFSFLLFISCSNSRGNLNEKHKELAERFNRGVYGCNPSVIDDIAAEDIVVSYPSFETFYGKPTIHGREAVKKLSTDFCQDWTDIQITIHDLIAEGDKVVCLWTTKARKIGGTGDEEPQSDSGQGIGGITIYRFDSTGKIVSEIGEESVPGPFNRLLNAQSEK
jgi:hypothetical protein